MDLPPLDADDLHNILSLLSRLAVSNDPVAARKRQLAEGLAHLIAADVWIWMHGRTHLPKPSPGGSMLDGGWKDERQKTSLLSALADDDWHNLRLGRLSESLDGRKEAPLAPPPSSAVRPRAHFTRTRRELLSDDEWYGSAHCIARQTPAGLDDFVLSAYPLDGGAWSTLAFWRSRGALPFGNRDRHVVHLVASEIDGLHRLEDDATTVPPGPDPGHLSPRQHQVLQLLLAGDANKQIARKLRISQHTVSDYVKALHARFRVHSRSQLLARFVNASAGGEWNKTSAFREIVRPPDRRTPP
jgi:DNA-binding CsgD family transcriptional regulator